MERFKIAHDERIIDWRVEGDTDAVILVDTITGVNYLMIQDAETHNKAITPLLNPDGYPVVTK